MKYLLPRLMATLTQHDRQIVKVGVDFKWSKNCWTHNVFRLYELVFGRRIGIRFEGATLQNEYGEPVHVFGTFENFIVFCEGAIRSYLKTWQFGFKIVPVPVFATPLGAAFKSPFMFAVAYVNANSVGGATTPQSTSVSVSGSNTIILGLPTAQAGSSGANPLNTSTYSGTNMSNIITTNIGGTTSLAYWVRIDYLVAPSAGTNSYQISESGGQYCNGAVAASYSGVSQTAPDNSGISFTYPNGLNNTLSLTINTSTQNCWMVMFAMANNGVPAASTNFTARTTTSVWPFGGDSNGTITTGGYTMAVTGSSGGSIGVAIGVTLAPPATATVTPLLSLMGVGV